MVVSNSKGWILKYVVKTSSENTGVGVRGVGVRGVGVRVVLMRGVGVRADAACHRVDLAGQV